MNIILVLTNAFLLSLLLSFSHGLLKWVADQKAESYFALIAHYWWIICISICIYIFIFFYYTHILRFTKIGVLYPIYTGLSIIFVFLIGIWWFQETTTLPQLIGCLLIIFGIIMVAGKIT